MRRSVLGLLFLLSSHMPPKGSRKAPAVTHDTLHTLIAACETAGASVLASVSALASLTAELVARNHESTQLALSHVASSRSALFARKTRVLGCAKRLSRKQCKRLVAELEAADVSEEQVCVWAAVVGATTACPDLLECALPLLAPLLQAQSTGICVGGIPALSFSGELGCVATGDGLRVVSAAGPGLDWYKPNAHNEFSVVVAQADGRVPVWLTMGDVAVTVSVSASAAAANALAGAVSMTAAVTACDRGVLSVAYGGLHYDTPDVVLQLAVCGVFAVDVSRFYTLRACVRRRPTPTQECAALGTHVRTLAVVDGVKCGVAVSPYEEWLVVGLQDEGTLYVYSLPGGELVRTFGGRGDGPLQFNGLRRLCFGPNGNVIAVDAYNSRLQEVTLEGVFVRHIGMGEFIGRSPAGVDVHADVIAVACDGGGTALRVVLFDFGTGARTNSLGQLGIGRGKLSLHCTGVRFSPDGRHLIVTEHSEQSSSRLSVFTAAGAFVRSVSVGYHEDALNSVTGDLVVMMSGYCRVLVFSPDGSKHVRSWGVKGVGDGQFECPTALAAAGRHLYVMERSSGRVQVFD